MNRYRLTRLLGTFIKETSTKYGLLDNPKGADIKIEFDKHIPDRILDREFPKEIMSKMITRMIKYHTAKIVVECTKVNRVNLYYEDYMIGVTGNMTESGNKFIVRMRTCYKERNHGKRKRMHETSSINLITGEVSSIERLTEEDMQYVKERTLTEAAISS